MQELTRRCLDRVTGGEWPEVDRVNVQDNGTYIVYRNRAVTSFPAPGRDIAPATTLPPGYFRRT